LTFDPVGPYALKRGNPTIPVDIDEIEWTVSLGDVQLLECSLGLPCGNQVETKHRTSVDIVRVKFDRPEDVRSRLIVVAVINVKVAD